jgi:hypothetical protein
VKSLRAGYALIACALLGAAGCSSTEGNGSKRALVPVGTSNLSVSLDGLFQNWNVEIAPLGMQRYGVSLTMRRIFTGGEGESAPVLRHVAEKLREQGGYTGYVLLDQSEGIKSQLPFAQRVAYAVVELY